VARLPASPAPVLVALDAFKGTMTASQVTAALVTGLRGAGVQADPCPVADGGEGTLEALAEPLRARRLTVTVSDPLGRPVPAELALTDRRHRAPPTAVVEVAAASGLGLVSESERDPVAASTFGTGELVAAALAAGAEVVYVAAGGSATVDGGAGAIRAIAAAGGLGAARLVVLCDVRTPWQDAARVFGPQKGAGAEAVALLSRRLDDLAGALPRDPRGVAMTGAAGGLAGGLWAELGAELRAGAPFVLDAVGFDARLRRARAVLTGEGRLDEQSLAGKAVSEVATRARQTGVPCYAVAGACELDRFGQRILDLQAVRQAGSLAALEREGAALAGLIFS